MILRIVVLFILNIQFSNAFDIETASKIFDKLFYAVLQKEEIFVFTKDEEYKKVIINSKYLKIVDDSTKCDIILANDKNDFKSSNNKMVFTTQKELLDEQENVIGAFYWNKGKPEIIFLKERIEKNNLKLQEGFEKYAK